MPGPCTVCSHPKLREIEALLGQGLSGNEVANRFGLNRNAVYRHWKVHALKRITAKRQAKAEKATEAYISARENRIAAKDDRWKRLHQVMQERGADPSMETVPGGRTGLLVRKLKKIGSGKDAETVEEYEVDAGLLSEARQLEESAAKDLGQWIPEGQDASRAGSAQVVIILPDAGAPVQVETAEVPVIDLAPRRDLPGVYQPVRQIPAADHGKPEE